MYLFFQAYDEQFKIESASVAIEAPVSSTLTTTSISAPVISYGTDGSLTVTVSSTSGTPTGNVTLSVDGGTALSQTLTPVSASSPPAARATFTLTKPALGSHTLSASYAAQGGLLASSASGSLFVSPRALTITADAQSKTVGAADSAMTYQITSGSLLTGDSITGSLTRVAGETAGTYVIGQGTLSAGNNYQITYVGANFTITALGQVIVTQIDSSLCSTVNSYVTVKNQSGAAATGLDSSWFSLLEDGVTKTPLTIAPVAAGTSSASIGMVLDYSGSMAGQPIADMQNAATSFIGQLGSNDSAEIIKFATTVDPVQAFTTNKNDLINAITAWYGNSGSTALYDGIYKALTDSDVRTGRKALVVMTDGEDNNSAHTLADTSALALIKGVPIYTIGLGYANQTVLQQLATDTNGQFHAAATSADLQAVYQAIAAAIQSQYIVTHTTSKQDGAAHTVRVTVIGGGIAASGANQFTACGSTSMVTPSAGANGSITPNTPQLVTSGTTASFTITPNSGYKIVTPIVGACPPGTLNGTTYTTGTVISNCTVAPTFVLNKSIATVTLGSLAQTYNGAPKTASATTAPYGLAVLYTYNGSTVPPTAAGSYTVVGTINDIAYQGSATGTLVIAPKSLTVTATGINKVYDGINYADVTYSDNRVAGDTFTVQGTAAFGNKDVGSAKVVSVLGINISGAQAANYTLSSNSTTTTANITPRTITITADPKTKVSGDSDPAFTWRITGSSLAWGDSISGGLTRMTGENPGVYELYQGTINAGNNYAISYVYANLTITAAAAVPSISPRSQQFPATGGTGSVAVTLGASYSWTAVSNTAWITVTSGASGSGNGTVGYSVAANNSSAPRAGAITIAGLYFVVTQGVPLGDAVDAPALNWTTGGNNNWTVQSTTTHDGSDAAQSGYSILDQPNWIETTVSGPGTATFWWKVASGGSDIAHLTFSIDDVQQTGGLTGNAGWVQASYTTSGAGNHTLRWTYSVNGSIGSASSGAWLDQFVFTPSTPGQPLLTVNKAGNGNGTITANPGPLSWSGNTGVAYYAPGTVVTLTATAQAGSVFDGWSGCYSTAGTACTVSMDSAWNVTATFTGARILLFDNSLNELGGALTKIGYQYTNVHAATFASTTLSSYDIIMTPWQMLAADNQALVNRKTELDSWVKAGGRLFASSALDESGYGVNNMSWLPLSVTPYFNGWRDDVTVIAPNHPIMSTPNVLTSSNMSNWGNSYHNVYIAHDPGYEELATNSAGQTLILAGSYGAGMIVVSGSDPEYHTLYGPTAGQWYLENLFNWVGTTNNGRISGTVTNSLTGLPIAGVAVRAVGPVTASGVTGADGTYTINNLPSGSYTAIASMAGFAASSGSIVTVADKTTTTANFSLTGKP